MNADQLIENFLAFFESKNHSIIPSASVIPDNDPTVLFTTAGMQPLIPFLTGRQHPLGQRLANVQRCIRTNDIDQVGDATHLTFFEMLGNWSLGDYFKEEAISWSFEFLTQKLNIPLTHLAVTCFAGDAHAPKDEQAAQIWKKLGVSEKRIAFLPKEDNWWGPAGQTGPCGPDTEMFYWKAKTPPPETFDPENENWVEIWNDVFMQYNKQTDGTYSPLSQKNVDTGMGVERVSMLLQQKTNVYQTELFTPILEKIAQISQKTYDSNQQSFRIIADHIKAATMMLGDEKSITPSNVDQGYVLRKLIRRAIRHGHKLDMQQFCAPLAQIVIDMYKDRYPVLLQNKQHILDQIQREEEKFLHTIEKGLRLITKKLVGLAIKQKGIDYIKQEQLLGKEEQICKKLSVWNIDTIDFPPSWYFDLYQSHGLPLELTIEEIESFGLVIEKKEALIQDVSNLFKEHQEKSRLGAQQKFKGGLADDSEQTTKLHTATHLLNEALRRVIDPAITQKGSNITAKRLRFDFNYDKKLTPEQLQAVEDEVNSLIKQALPITQTEMTPEKAKEQGAQAEFGARYPPKVSVYDIGEYSKEICMGPHVQNTKDIGTFKIIKEESSAAGIRRIKAIVE
ncbi:MAG: alanine--tRNA ligase-related protein, partial [Candidatus Woesearchaeota archaeon]